MQTMSTRKWPYFANEARLATLGTAPTVLAAIFTFPGAGWTGRGAVDIASE